MNGFFSHDPRLRGEISDHDFSAVPHGGDPDLLLSTLNFELLNLERALGSR
jgi:hypothetical protein